MLYLFMQPLGDRLNEFGQHSFSQFGENVPLCSSVETLGIGDRNGFYVDVGEHDIRKRSDTLLLLKFLGWADVNTEPDPTLFQSFVLECPECLNLQMAIGTSEGTTELTIYNHPAANTTSDVLRVRQAADSRIEVVDTATVPIAPLNLNLERHLPSDQDFRLLTIDADGSDLDIVTSVDFTRFRPTLLMIEDFTSDLAQPDRSEIFRHCRSVGYHSVCHAMTTTHYRYAS